jgi:hypothetical protein
MKNLGYIEIIRNHLGEREILEQMAEEATELAQAALKCIRAMDESKNPTPLSLTAATANLVEEYGDVGVAWAVLFFPTLKELYQDEDMPLAQPQEMKLKRWAERVTGKEVD